MLFYIDRAVRIVAAFLAYPLSWLLMPLKRLAWASGSRWLRGCLLEFTSFFDWVMTLLCIQNVIMQIQHRVWGGNFLFGKAVFVVDYATAAQEIPRPTMRGNHFMGIHIVTNESNVFMTNAGPITTSPPVRTATRRHMDEAILVPKVRAFERDGLAEHCADILAQWRQREDMISPTAIRTVVTRIYLKLLADVQPDGELARRVTSAYTRRFAEMSIFGRYMTWALGAGSTLEALREDVFLPLKRLGVDPVAIDMTLFAAMFSNGTWALHAIRFLRERGIDYCGLGPTERIGFLMEVQRLYPTVTTVHRIAEREEWIPMRRGKTRLRPGQEVCYPFVIINRDPDVFSDPESFDHARPPGELRAILSWSTGPHVCPAKELSIQVAKLLLDQMSERTDLRGLRLFAPEF